MKYKIGCGWTDPYKNMANFILHSLFCFYALVRVILIAEDLKKRSDDSPHLSGAQITYKCFYLFSMHGMFRLLQKK